MSAEKYLFEFIVKRLHFLEVDSEQLPYVRKHAAKCTGPDLGDVPVLRNGVFPH